MRGLKKLFSLAVLLFMVFWSLALLVPDQHDTQPAYAQIGAARLSGGTP
jgi:hypothetical protein